MVNKRNRILKIVEFLESCGIKITLAKNKARGNRGIFCVKNEKYRIDISKFVEEDLIIKTLAHEFAHFLHYSYDKNLNSLSFIFSDIDEEITEELLCLTVDSIPQETVKPLFQTKENLKKNILLLNNNLASKYKNFKRSVAYKPLEDIIKKTSLKYLLKYDRVKVFEGFRTSFYSVEDLDLSSDVGQYIKLKSLQRAQKRINTKIAKLNRYYNSPSELFARSFELYITNKEKLAKLAPKVYRCFEDIVSINKIPLMNKFIDLNSEILNI